MLPYRGGGGLPVVGEGSLIGAIYLVPDRCVPHWKFLDIALDK